MDAGGSQDAQAAADTATGTDSPADAPTQDAGVVPLINGCSADKYMDMSKGTETDRMVMINMSGAFDMPCMTIAAGQSVMFMWDLATYPIAPGVAPSHTGDPTGTTPNVIAMRSTGMVYTVMFPSAGFYPFYVPGHDMLAGTIQVL
jgi:hypothetical protein